jgi:DNA repair exonuclease SbcCD ATPase subunit
MKTTTIKVQDKSEMRATGHHTNKNAKPVFCISTGEVFASVFDAAESVSSSHSNMSWALTQRMKTCKGKRWCFVSEIPEHLEEIANNMRARESKIKAYDAIIAEQEAIKKANEELAKRKADVEKRKANVEKLRAQLEKETASMHEAEEKLNELTNVA